ncbi:hypothetical protein D9M72_637170 [compost metagenome]
MMVKCVATVRLALGLARLWLWACPSNCSCLLLKDWVARGRMPVPWRSVEVISRPLTVRFLKFSPCPQPSAAITWVAGPGRSGSTPSAISTSSSGVKRA